MSDPVREAKALLAPDLVRFEETLLETLKPQAEYLTRTEYETYRRGKRLRPVLLLLSARSVLPADTAALPDKLIKAAVSLEKLHVATLIHDDIVDVAPMRRGMQTVFSERGAEMAVLIGDMQFIQAIRCFVDGIDVQKDMELVKMVLNVGFDLCRGELDEILTDPSIGIEKLINRYFRTVDRKTSTLFALACALARPFRSWTTSSTCCGRKNSPVRAKGSILCRAGFRCPSCMRWTGCRKMLRCAASCAKKSTPRSSWRKR